MTDQPIPEAAADAVPVEAEPTPAPVKLDTRKLGKTGIELSELTVGTWGLSSGAYGEVATPQRERTIRRALELGVRAFDMAPSWGNGRAESETAALVSERRNELVYITRAGQRVTPTGVSPAFDADSLRADCLASLERLRTDRIDVWLLHSPTALDLRSEAVRSTVEALVTEGKVRAWGASVQHLDEARAAIEVGAQVLCLPFHMLAPRMLWDITNEAEARGVGLLARSVLAHGLLAGRWPPRRRFPEHDHRNQRWNPEALEARVKQVTDLYALLENPPMALASVSLRFVLAHQAVSSAVVGPRTVSQIEASVHALTEKPYMKEEDIARIRARSD